MARKVAELYYKLGILSTKEYIECSASDLVAQYVGQTGPKTRNMLTKALGKVLFVDEAYRLCDGQFGKEAVDELVDSITKLQFKGKVVVILAGYTQDIDRLLQINRGLASRFPGEVNFNNMTPAACLELLRMELQKSAISLSPDCCKADSPTHARLVQLLEQLARLPSWGNGRDVVTIAKDLVSAIFERADESTTQLVATGDDVLLVLRATLSTQMARTSVTAPTNDVAQLGSAEVEQTSCRAPQTSGSVASAVAEPVRESDHEKEGEAVPPSFTKVVELLEEQRDIGVSDNVWRQLQADKHAEAALNQDFDRAIDEATESLAALVDNSKASSSELARLEKLQEDKDTEAASELKRKREQERIRLLNIRRQKEALEEKMKRMREAEEASRKKEAEAQKKLRSMGVCPVGFRWIKQNGGYRCAGGSHFVTDAALEA